MARPKTNKSCAIADCGGQAVSRGLCCKHYTRWRKNGSPTVTKKAPTGEPMQFLLAAQAASKIQCVEWPYAKAAGYGLIQQGKTTVPAHRKQTTLCHGDPPSDIHQAAHICGNRLCVNPHHLRWATPVENAADRVLHGTHVYGEKQGQAKLTAHAVMEIRRLHAAGASTYQLAEQFGIAPSHAYRVASKLAWAWLD